MMPVVANGQPAAAAYQRAADGTYQGYGIAALDVSENGIGRIIVFGGGAELLARFGLPAQRSQ